MDPKAGTLSPLDLHDKNLYNLRITVEVKQEYPAAVLAILRADRFGSIYIKHTKQKSGKIGTYFAWYTSDRELVMVLITLLRGNLILKKRQEQLTKVIDAINYMWDAKLEHKPFKSDFTLNDPWLLGFFDAEANIYSNYKNGFCEGYNYYRIELSCQLRQDGEKEALENYFEFTCSVSWLN